MSDEEKIKTFGVSIVNTEYYHIYVENDSKESIMDAIINGSFTHIETEDSKIKNIHEIK